MKKGLGWIALLIVLLLVYSGCAPIQWWDSGTNGPSFRCKDLNPIVPRGLLGKYKNVEVCQFTEQIPHLAPSEIVTAVAPEVASELKETKLFLVVTTTPDLAPEGTLTIRGEIIYYDPGEINERVLAMSGESELIARITLVDKESGEIIGTCDSRGIVKTTFNQPERVSLGVAKGVVKWIKENHPLSEKTE